MNVEYYYIQACHVCLNPLLSKFIKLHQYFFPTVHFIEIKLFENLASGFSYRLRI